MPYDRQEYLTNPARPRAEIWRTVLGAGLIVGVYLGAALFLLLLLTILLGPEVMGRVVSAGSPTGVLALLGTHALLALAVALVLRALHQRGLRSLLGAPKPFARDFLRTGLPLLGLTLILLPLTTGAEAVTRCIDLGQWLVLLPLSLGVILIQTGAEELAFRGYLQSQLAARFKSPLIWIGLPSLLFGLVHAQAARFGDSNLMIMLWAAIFGLVAADLTARTGTLGAAIALHFVNNISSILLVGIKGDLDALALWGLTVDVSDPAQLLPYMLVDLVWLLIAWLIARLMLRV